MRGIKGTGKRIGDPCARCRKPLTALLSVPRRDRGYLLSYCRPCMSARDTAQRAKFPERASARGRRYKASLRTKVLAAYGAKCACCGERQKEFLALDHVNGGGNKERREKGLSTSAQMYMVAIHEGFPARFRLLCHNCNCSRAWYGFCPHDANS